MALVTEPINPLQPVNPAPLQTPYPPNEVLLPFQPPVSYIAGQYSSGKTLLELIESGHPLAEMGAATIAGNVAQQPPDDITVTVYDQFYNPVGEINDYISLTCQFARNKVAGAEIVLKGIDPLADTVLGCALTTVPITIETGNLRWSGRVFTAEGKFANRVDTIVVQCVSDYAWLDKILCWPAPELPIEVQFPAQALYIGPACTVVATLIAEQAFRLQSGIYNVINNLGSASIGDVESSEDGPNTAYTTTAADVAGWAAWKKKLNSGGIINGLLEILAVPLCVISPDSSTDTSPWVSITGRMDKCSTLIEQVVKDTGTNVTVNLWLPGDPQPDGLVVDLTVATLIVQVQDDLGVTGVAGNFLDGILQDAVDLGHSLLGNVLEPLLNPDNEFSPQGINIAPVLGVNFVQPWVLMTDTPRGGLIDASIKARTPLAFSMIGGGKSPQWLDDLLNILAEWALSSINILIGLDIIPTSLFDGIIDDVIFAFQEVTNESRRMQLGPYAWPEYFTQTGTAAYTLDEWFALQVAMWDTRGMYTYTWTLLNNFPYQLGVDLIVGQLASYAYRGQLYTDWVDSITFTDDRTTRVAKLYVVVGDGKFVENPVTKLERKVIEFENAVQTITLSYN